MRRASGARIPAFSAFVTAGDIRQHLRTGAGLARAVRLMRAAGVSKAYLDVFRGGWVERGLLERVRDRLRSAGFQVSGGISPLCAPGHGVPQKGLPRAHCCYTAQETLEHIARMARLAAGLFDEIIIDDFLCTQCRCARCQAARGSASWGDFRRALLAKVANEALLSPARQANPRARLILKYPQWYDRFHVFGYDVTTHPSRFDGIWAGTETRDVDVEYVQPYQAYFNHRWIRSLAGRRMGGAWFDQINTSPATYLEQAYQSVLAGAQEIVLFHYSPQQFAPDNADMAALVSHMPRLRRLARLVSGRKPQGIHAYKPPDSDGEDEAYVFDYMGMFGLPLVPCSEFPSQAKAIFLPVHAAADPELPRQLDRFLKGGGTALVTAGLLERLQGEASLIAAAGYGADAVRRVDAWTHRFRVRGSEVTAPGFVRIGAVLRPRRALVLAEALVPEPAPVLTVNRAGRGTIAVVSACTMRYATDSDRLTVGEPVSLINLPDALVNCLRQIVMQPLGFEMAAPSKVGLYVFRGGVIALCNFNDKPVQATLRVPGRWCSRMRRKTALGVGRLGGRRAALELKLPARSTEAISCRSTRAR